MKKEKTIVVSLCLLMCLLFASCSVMELDREMTVSIPVHPWEKSGGEKNWYTLKWTTCHGIETLHVGKDQRRVTIRIPVGETVVICAYPLGEFNPFGAVITPLDCGDSVTLSQNDGCIANELLNLDREVVRQVNYGLVSQSMYEKCDDFRQIDIISFIRDLQNEELAGTSFKVVSLFGVDPFSLPNGIWVSEFVRDPVIISQGGMTSQLQLPEGVFHYLNTEMDRILVLIVDSGGYSYSYLRRNVI